jgi:hypothetical protein
VSMPERRWICESDAGQVDGSTAGQIGRQR